MQTIVPGPPYLFGVFTVATAMMIAFFIPKSLDHVYRPLATQDNNTPSEGLIMSFRTSKKINEKLSDSDEAILIEAGECEL